MNMEINLSYLFNEYKKEKYPTPIDYDDCLHLLHISFCEKTSVYTLEFYIIGELTQLDTINGFTLDCSILDGKLKLSIEGNYRTNLSINITKKCKIYSFPLVSFLNNFDKYNKKISFFYNKLLKNVKVSDLSYSHSDKIFTLEFKTFKKIKVKVIEGVISNYVTKKYSILATTLKSKTEYYHYIHIKTNYNTKILFEVF